MSSSTYWWVHLQQTMTLKLSGDEWLKWQWITWRGCTTGATKNSLHLTYKWTLTQLTCRRVQVQRRPQSAENRGTACVRAHHEPISSSEKLFGKFVCLLVPLERRRDLFVKSDYLSEINMQYNHLESSISVRYGNPLKQTSSVQMTDLKNYCFSHCKQE